MNGLPDGPNLKSSGRGQLLIGFVEDCCAVFVGHFAGIG